MWVERNKSLIDKYKNGSLELSAGQKDDWIYNLTEDALVLSEFNKTLEARIKEHESRIKEVELENYEIRQIFAFCSTALRNIQL